MLDAGSGYDPNSAGLTGQGGLQILPNRLPTVADMGPAALPGSSRLWDRLSLSAQTLCPHSP